LFFFAFFYRALAALGFGSSLPFCAEKRSSLLHESEETFVALLGKHPFVVTKARRLSWCCAAVLRANTTNTNARRPASSPPSSREARPSERRGEEPGEAPPLSRKGGGDIEEGVAIHPNHREQIKGPEKGLKTFGSIAANLSFSQNLYLSANSNSFVI
jgi:hypothetical protein